MTGTVQYYKMPGGYGFIIAEDGSKIFVHHSELKNRKRLRKGQKITYEMGEHEGKAVAVNVNVVEAAK